MATTQDEMIFELQRANAELRQERDAALAQRSSEYGERIAHQAATIDVLKAMSASPGDPQTVFDLIVRRAKELCNGRTASLLQFRDGLVHWGAVTQTSDLDRKSSAFAAYRASFPMVPTRGSIPCRAILDKQVIHIKDTLNEPGLSEVVRGVIRERGYRSQLVIPLIRGGQAIGCISLSATETGGFSDTQIDLLKTFAEQAVIAIGSAETYRALQTRTSDLQQSLEYQTATSDVLNVISRSTFDLQPVLDTVVETAAKLCVADMAHIGRREGEAWRFAANYGFPPEYETHLKGLGPVKLDPNSPTIAHRTAIEGRPVHIDDVAAVPGYPDASIRLGKQRTSLGVPLLRGGETIGVIQLSRQRVEPFTDRQIALVSTFADQAVIAIENTRLLTEQREALEQQTATAEVLQVINASPGNLTPVFDTILAKALRLCEAAFGSLVTYDGEYFQVAATRGLSAGLAKALRERGPLLPSKSIAYDQIVRGADIVHIPDIIALGAPFPSSPNIDQDGARTTLFVALRGDDALFGAFVIYRKEVRLFSDKQIALLKNFAAQAVIAMENARLLTEQREALEQQTATAEVLQVINASPGNLQPVFDTILEKAMRLCGAAFGSMYTYDGDRFHSAAQRGVPKALAEFRAKNPPAELLGGRSPIARLIKEKRPVHILDILDEEVFRYAGADGRAIFDLGGARTILYVPLVKDDTLQGYISIYRQEVRTFTDKQIALLQSFAAQAVIAIENARLLTEQREALEQQTATAEVLQVINASPGDLQPVFDVILAKAHGLCDIAQGSLELYDGERFRAVAVRGLSDAFVDMLRLGYPASDNPATRPLIGGSRFSHIRDLAETDYSITQSSVELAAARTLLCVPLRRDETLLGMIASARREVRPFSEKEIALLENFAAQAVIAMENARLLEEIRQRQEELRITFENMGDGVAMFDTDLRLTAWNRNFQRIIDLPDTLLETRLRYADYLRLLAERGEFGTTDIEEELRHRIEDTDQELRLERVRPDGRVIEVRRNAVSGGGFVLIYSDITERKRSEEQIRAARDAAEAALRELRTAQANLIQAEKMASLGQLTAGIAHEIKNPLNFVNNFAALSVDLLSELKETAAPGFAVLSEKQRSDVEDVSAMLTSNLEKITEHGKRADGIVKAMLEHSRGSSGERRVVDLNALIDEALNLAYHGARAQDQSFNITLERDFGVGISPIEVNPQDMTRVFLNIFSNGFYATTKRARDGGDAGFAPTLKITTRDTGDAVEIRVRDNGTGIPADVRDKIFEPFYSTKPTGQGTGLGLSITYDIVTQQHGGTIAADSNVGEYSEFTIRLPRNP